MFLMTCHDIMNKFKLLLRDLCSLVAKGTGIEKIAAFSPGLNCYCIVRKIINVNKFSLVI